MFRLPFAVAVLLLVPTWGFAQDCLHGPNETAMDRTRREQAIKVADAINAQQAAAIAGSLSSRYRRVSELKLPEIPDNFAVALHLNGRTTYSFSLKDHSDPCYFAIFSDQDGFVYASHPHPQPQPTTVTVPAIR